MICLSWRNPNFWGKMKLGEIVYPQGNYHHKKDNNNKAVFMNTLSMINVLICMFSILLCYVFVYSMLEPHLILPNDLYTIIAYLAQAIHELNLDSIKTPCKSIYLYELVFISQ